MMVGLDLDVVKPPISYPQVLSHLKANWSVHDDHLIDSFGYYHLN